MNDRLREYRERNKKDEKPPQFTAKDWITTSLSILAFLLSLVTAYFNVARQADDLEAVAPIIPELIWLPDNRELLTQGDTTQFVFVNAGNRAATILKTSFWIVQPKEDDANSDYDQQCADNLKPSGFEAQEFPTSFGPFVIKEREALLKAEKLPKTTRDPAFYFEKWNYDREQFPVLVCAWFVFATPSNSLGRSVKWIETYRIKRNGVYSNIKLEKRATRPISIYQHTSVF